MSDEIEQEIAKVVVDLRKAGKKGPGTVKIYPRDFWNMIHRLSAKVEMSDDHLRREFVTLHVAGVRIRVEPDIETLPGHVDITSEALEDQ